MANEFRSLIDILRDLKALALKKASGFFFVVTEDNHSCTIRLRGGQIEDVVFSRHRSDDAVLLLAAVPAGRARFQADPASTGTPKVSLSETSLRWLMGGFEAGSGIATTAARAPAPASIAASTPAGNLGAPQREVIEKVALNYFGPIASVLCDEAFAGAGNIERVLLQIASNLPNRDEEDRFLADARQALGLS